MNAVEFDEDGVVVGPEAPEVLEVPITYFTYERFLAHPQVGLRVAQEWPQLLRWLTTPKVVATKQQAGAWCPCDLAGGIVRGGHGDVALLVADVDECAEGALDKHAEILSAYEGVIIPTFNATVDKPKHRIVLRLSRPMKSMEFKLAWPKFFHDMLDADILLDKGCKNINRLYFACAVKSQEAWLGCRFMTGTPIDVDAMLEGAREFVAREKARMEVLRRDAAARAEERAIDGRNGRYVNAALLSARINVVNSTEGNRHETLLKEAYSLARLGIGEVVIYNALLDAFIACAGEDRRREGERAVHDAVVARERRPD